MRRNRRFLLVIAWVGLALIGWALLTIAMVGSTLEPQERETVIAILAPRAVLVGLSWALAIGVTALVARQFILDYLSTPARLLEQTRILQKSEAPGALIPAGSTQWPELSAAINDLAQQRDALRVDVERQIAAAGEKLQAERNRLASLISDLKQSIVVCNTDGRIVLYNNRARLQFKAFSRTPDLTGAVEVIGIGRSIYSVLSQPLITHGMQTIRHRLARGASGPSTQFLTSTKSGQLLRIHMAAIHGTDADYGDTRDLTGFILTLENVTRAFEDDSNRGNVYRRLTERSESSLAATSLLVERLSQAPSDLVNLQAIVRDLKGELANLRSNLASMAAQSASSSQVWAHLEAMQVADFLAVALPFMETRCQQPVKLLVSDEDAWLRVDSYSLLQAIAFLAGRVASEFDVKLFQLRLTALDGWGQLDLIWSGDAVSTETMMSWQLDAMQVEGGGSPLSVRDVLTRHGGKLDVVRDRARHEALFRLNLPLVNGLESDAPPPTLPGDSRPEFYDFDLFQVTNESRLLEDQPLSSLSFTVFDTETTGLNPSGGDEIIQIGAVRVVNGRVLRGEYFDQLVDPGRPIPSASIPIHGITQDMVTGRPGIIKVLPAFHAFSQDTIFVAHNAAFDMRFLQLKEAATGLTFHQPVLDTLLLSAVVHPNQNSHRLEAIAERFNVPVTARHTALGDAMVTAEVLLRLLPLLEEMGISTLRAAREASQKSYFARLKY